MATRRAISIAVGLALVLGSWVLSPGTATAATTWTWPSASCASTVQACIDAAASGDTVVIDSDAIIGLPLQIVDKGLTLRAAAGRHPSIAPSPSFGLPALTIRTASPPGAMIVTVQDIRFAGQVWVQLLHGSGHDVTFRRVRIDVPADAAVLSAAALDVVSTVFSSFEFLDGAVTTAIPGAVGISLDAAPTDSYVHFRVVGVRVQLKGPTSESGLRVAGEGPGGSVRAEIFNNVIYRTSRCGCSAPAVHLVGAGGTTTVIFFVGNTIDRVGPGATGLLVHDTLPSGQSMLVRAFNNILSHVDGYGIWIAADHPSTLRFNADYNDFYDISLGNHLGGFSLGSENLHLPPKFVDEPAGKLALKASSPLIDRGLTCTPAGQAGPDIAGNNRRAGKSVDIGAYEHGAGEPGLIVIGGSNDEELNGGSGSDILCGYAGGDLMDGAGGGDFIDGGKGPDFLIGGRGNDRLFGRAGGDLLCALDAGGGDYLNGGPGTDMFRANAGDTLVSVEERGGPCPGGS